MMTSSLNGQRHIVDQDNINPCDVSSKLDKIIILLQAIHDRPFKELSEEEKVVKRFE
jgi:hypothetical protein